jgi:hypothetical protein
MKMWLNKHFVVGVGDAGKALLPTICKQQCRNGQRRKKTPTIGTGKTISQGEDGGLFCVSSVGVWRMGQANEGKEVQAAPERTDCTNKQIVMNQTGRMR